MLNSNMGAPGPGASQPYRILVAKPGLDGHDRGAKLVARALRDAGFEVIYTGLRWSPEAIVNVAIQEDVDLIGLSILSGAHLPLTRDVLRSLSAKGSQIGVVVGGTVPPTDLPRLLEDGVVEVFLPEGGMAHLVERVRAICEARSGVEAE